MEKALEPIADLPVCQATFAAAAKPCGRPATYQSKPPGSFYCMLCAIRLGMFEYGPIGDPVKPAAELPQPEPGRCSATARTDLLVVDNFYENPEQVRQFAMGLPFVAQTANYKGLRSTSRHLFPGVKERIEQLLGLKIPNWEKHGFNGVFQVTSVSDPLVYHSDTQDWAGAVYLSPTGPYGAGTSFWASKITKLRYAPSPQTIKRFPALADKPLQEVERQMYADNLLSDINWDLVDRVGSVWNRLVIWNARMVHSASAYFGSTIEDGRLAQLFFFDTE